MRFRGKVTTVRIAVVAAHQGVVGGAETYNARLLKELLTRGHQLAFAFEFAAPPERAVDRGLEPLVRWDLSTMPRSAFHDRLTEFDPDIVFLQGSDDPAIELELSQRFRTILFAHGFYGACATGQRVHRIPERKVCTRRFGVGCLPVNYLRGCGALSPLQLLKLYGSERTRARVLPEVSAVVVASEYMRQLYLDHGIPGDNLHLIRFPAEHRPDPTPPPSSQARDRVLYLGRLTSAKGCANAVLATARCQRALGRPLHLTVAGDGPELDRCRRLAKKLGVRTDFIGWVGSDQRTELLRKADVLIVPSLWPEPFGIVGIEAAAVGLPAVAYATGGIVDWLRAGESGELADGSGFGVRPLAVALERALRDPEHHRRLQLGAWRVAQEFDAELHFSRLEQLFVKLFTRICS
ncbi:MAG TPA: glycosyltransferase [Polyangiaceae bacterium]|nr:glycosyltransferase [Polyangiaceae bacterium]